MLDLLPWFVALTVNVYDTPLVKFLTSQVSGFAGVVRVHEHDLNTEPTFGDAVTLYSLIAAPPVDDGATHDTSTDLLRGEPATDRATDGTTADTVTCCACPTAAAQIADDATCATNEHDPVAMNDTAPVPTFTVHTLVSELVTDFVPSLLVVNVGVKEPFTTAEAGRLDIETEVLAFATLTC